jgi:drug/metabolite transporter (DMT)-like permease
VATVPLIALAWLRWRARPGAMVDIWPVIAYTGPLATALTFIVVLNVTQSLPPAATSIAMLGVPVIGLVLSAVAWHEQISLDLSIGLALIGWAW